MPELVEGEFHLGVVYNFHNYVNTLTRGVGQILSNPQTFFGPNFNPNPNLSQRLYQIKIKIRNETEPHPLSQPPKPAGDYTTTGPLKY